MAGTLFVIISQSIQTSAVLAARNNQTACLKTGGQVLPSGQARYLLCRGADGVLSRISPLTEEEAMAAVRRAGAERKLERAQP